MTEIEKWDEEALWMWDVPQPDDTLVVQETTGSSDGLRDGSLPEIHDGHHPSLLHRIRLATDQGFDINALAHQGRGRG
ncbi:MAG: hypothetical protein AMXMBFR53_26450 [Gemmatimonadota bacterium]